MKKLHNPFTGASQPVQEMKETYHFNGLCQKLIKRSNNIAMYSVHLEENSPITGYEVFRIKFGKAESIRGKDYPEREVYPSNEDFGRIAWSWNSFEKANEQYEMLCNQKEVVNG